MKHVMIDLETLGTKVDAVFIAIGAIYFDPDKGKIGEEFYVNVDWQDSIDFGRTITGDTIKWWFQQSNKARRAVVQNGMPLKEALFLLNHFLDDGVIVWSNGSIFDISMLEHAYSELKLEVPWQFWNVRDVRTIKDLGKYLVDKEIFKMEGTEHNALDDAKHQAKYVSVLWQKLKGRTNDRN